MIRMGEISRTALTGIKTNRPEEKIPTGRLTCPRIVYFNITIFRTFAKDFAAFSPPPESPSATSL